MQELAKNLALDFSGRTSEATNHVLATDTYQGQDDLQKELQVGKNKTKETASDGVQNRVVFLAGATVSDPRGFGEAKQSGTPVKQRASTNLSSRVNRSFHFHDQTSSSPDKPLNQQTKVR